MFKVIETCLAGCWPLSQGWCVFYQTCDVLACSVSILHLMFISIGLSSTLLHSSPFSSTVLHWVKISVFRPLQRDKTATAPEDPGRALHPLQSCPHLGSRPPPGLPNTRPRHPRHPQHHADQRGVRDEQPALPDLRVPAGFLHPHGDYGDHLRSDSSPSEETEALHSDWRQASDQQERDDGADRSERKYISTLQIRLFLPSIPEHGASYQTATGRNGSKFTYNCNIASTETSHR